MRVVKGSLCLGKCFEVQKNIGLVLFCFKNWSVAFFYCIFSLALVLNCHLNKLSVIPCVSVSCLSFILTTFPSIEVNFSDLTQGNAREDQGT